MAQNPLSLSYRKATQTALSRLNEVHRFAQSSMLLAVFPILPPPLKYPSWLYMYPVSPSEFSQPGIEIHTKSLHFQLCITQFEIKLLIINHSIQTITYQCIFLIHNVGYWDMLGCHHKDMFHLYRYQIAACILYR